MINEDKLQIDLKLWFDANNLTKPHFWRRNKIAVLIKKELEQLGKWRMRARGNPRKGYLKMKENQNKNTLDF